MKFAKSVRYANITGVLKWPPEPLPATTNSQPSTGRGIDIVYISTLYISPDIRRPQVLRKTSRPNTDTYFCHWLLLDWSCPNSWLHKAVCLRHHLNPHIWWFSVFKAITADNGLSFKSATLYKLYAKYQIKENHSSRYHAPANRIVETFNKTLRTTLEKTMDKSKWTWLDELPEVLWAYRTTTKIAT